ncbi:pentatricopeptide repeat-containing protein At1g73710 isoform X3 [Rhodamnia argentea]|uniref:Pentatricopeptide repeat-containing protein At1g73710 isoform X3 n=1 Tax=Rhodamnia argentea TaxID=178133 RepID=A0ABM3HMG4_9MYRT|nr:pentatricopeptide repeat-containing protein At1g73710 isoform X3 [Rhodamnia argentea]
MLLPTCSSRELRNQSLHSHVLPHCKSHPRPHTSKGSVFLGFKLQCHSKALALPSKVSSSSGRKQRKTYGGVLPSVLRSLESEDDVEKALSSVCSNLSPKEQTVILKEQRCCERVVRVWEFFKSQEDYVPNVIHYNIVLRALGRAQKWDDLRRCWIEMAERGVFPTHNTYGMLVDVYGKAGMVKEALLWIKHMKLRGMFPDEVTMNTVVRVLKDAAEFDRAERFYKGWCDGRVELDDLELDSMVESENGFGLAPVSYKHFLSTELFKTGGRMRILGSTDSQISVRKPRLTSTYNTLIDLYGKAGCLEDAAAVFKEMLSSGVPMDIITFNTMIFTCGSHGHLSEAEALLNEMDGRGISPDTKTYNILLSLYAEAGNIDAALDCYGKIRKFGLLPDVVTHRAVIHVLCKRNMVEEVMSVIEQIRKSGSNIDEHSLPDIVKMYVNKGLLDSAEVLLESFQNDRELLPKTRAAIMDAYADKGFWAEAECVFLMKSIGQKKDVLEYNVMIKAYGVKPNEVVYGSLINGFAEAGRVEEALRYVRQMEQCGIPANKIVLTSLIKAYSKVGCLEGAKSVYERMKNMQDGLDVIASNSMITLYADLGMISEATLIFNGMREENLADGVSFANMMYLYKSMGMLDEAIEVAEEMKQAGLLRDCPSYNKVMACYATNGQLRQCGELLHEMVVTRKLLPDSGTFRVIFTVLKKGGMAIEAVKQLELSYHEGKPYARQAIISSVFSVVGLHALAYESCEVFSKTKLTLDSFVYNVCIYVYGALGDVDRALNIFMKMQDDGVKPDHVTYIVLVGCYGKSGMIEGVRRVHSQLKYREIEPNESLFEAVAEAYRNAKRPDLAELVNKEMNFAFEPQQNSDSETENE